MAENKPKIQATLGLTGLTMNQVLAFHSPTIESKEPGALKIAVQKGGIRSDGERSFPLPVETGRGQGA